MMAAEMNERLDVHISKEKSKDKSKDKTKEESENILITDVQGSIFT
jgi:hypothetical protein